MGAVDKYIFIFPISLFYTMADLQQNYRSSAIILYRLGEKEHLCGYMGTLFDEFSCNNIYGSGSYECFLLNRGLIMKKMLLLSLLVFIYRARRQPIKGDLIRTRRNLSHG